jgi:predicted dienelactone hydrolase
MEGLSPLKWAAWYPAIASAAERPISTPSWFREAPVARDAGLLPAERPHPLVLLSHGTGGVAAGLAWLGHRLAQRGFVVLAVNHHGNTAAEPYRAEGFLCLWERARDLSVLLGKSDWRERLGGNFNGDVYVGGFSAGAYTAMLLMGARVAYSQFESGNPRKSPIRGPREFPNLADEIPSLLESNAVFNKSWQRRSDSYSDERFSAALVLAPGRSVLGFATESLMGIDRPIRIIVGDADAIAPAAECSGWLHNHLRGSELEILGSGVGHYVFLPEATPLGLAEAPDILTDASGVDRRAIHDHVALSATTLFGSAPD